MVGPLTSLDILYVVVQKLGVAAKARRPELLAYGILIGLIAGFVTDAIVVAAGARATRTSGAHEGCRT